MKKNTCLICIIFLFLNYNCNIFELIPKEEYNTYEKYSELLVLGRLVANDLRGFTFSRGMNCSDAQLGSKPKKSIKMKNGINDKIKLTNDEANAETGKIKAGTLMDLSTPALPITETMIWFAVVLKKFQNIRPVNAYNA